MVSWRQRSVKTRLRNWVVRYFYSGWQPAAFCFGLLAVTGVLSWDVRLSLLVGVLCAIAFIGLLAATSWNLVKKRWLQSILSFGLLICFCYSLNMSLANHFLFAADDAVIQEKLAGTAVAESIDTTTEKSSPSAPSVTEEPTASETSAEADTSTDTRKSMESSMLEFYGHRGRNKQLRETQ